MLELNREYDYAGICDALGWEKVPGGGKRQRQLAAVKAAYEWHHPINPKTGKPNTRLYIFTKKLSEVKYEDGRKNNGRRPIIPEAEFETLLAHTVQTYGFETLPVSDSTTRALLFTSKIFEGFGFDVYGAINQLREETGQIKKNKLIDTLLSLCVVNKAHAFSIGRIAKRIGEGKSSLPKEVVYKKDASSQYMEASNELDSEYEEMREVWEYILTAGETMPADGTVAAGAREMARKAVLDKFDILDVREVNSVVVPTELIEKEIDQAELERAQSTYFDTVMTAIHKRVDALLGKELWGQSIYVDDSLRNALRDYMVQFDAIAKSFSPIHIKPTSKNI